MSALDDILDALDKNSKFGRSFGGMFGVIARSAQEGIDKARSELEELRKMANAKFSDRNAYALLQRLEKTELDNANLRQALSDIFNIADNHLPHAIARNPNDL